MLRIPSRSLERLRKDVARVHETVIPVLQNMNPNYIPSPYTIEKDKLVDLLASLVNSGDHNG